MYTMYQAQGKHFLNVLSHLIHAENRHRKWSDHCPAGGALCSTLVIQRPLSHALTLRLVADSPAGENEKRPVPFSVLSV